MFNHHDPQLKPWQRTEIRRVPQDLKEKLFTRDYPRKGFNRKFRGSNHDPDELQQLDEMNKPWCNAWKEAVKEK